MFLLSMTIEQLAFLVKRVLPTPPPPPPLNWKETAEGGLVYFGDDIDYVC